MEKTGMTTITAQEIKRRGIGAVEAAGDGGPVHVVRNNRIQYVVLREADYQALLGDLAEARLAASEADWRAGRVRRGNAGQLLAEVLDAKEA
jgi:PHD/YefM family antitoxin component YafN of YafNO toxin-antitoxin module